MVVGFTTTYAISAYHHYLGLVNGFLQVLQLPPPFVLYILYYGKEKIDGKGLECMTLSLLIKSRKYIGKLS
jgi:hypothetical protein